METFELVDGWHSRVGLYPLQKLQRINGYLKHKLYAQVCSWRGYLGLKIEKNRKCKSLINALGYTKRAVRNDELGLEMK